MITQIEQVRRHLKSGWSITPKEALIRYGAFRLASIIHILRTVYDMNITTIPTTNKETGNRYAMYKLNETVQLKVS